MRRLEAILSVATSPRLRSISAQLNSATCGLVIQPCGTVAYTGIDALTTKIRSLMSCI